MHGRPGGGLRKSVGTRRIRGTGAAWRLAWAIAIASKGQVGKTANQDYPSFAGHPAPQLTEGSSHEGHSFDDGSGSHCTGMSVPASAATTDPEVIIYRVPGVTDNGGS